MSDFDLFSAEPAWVKCSCGRDTNTIPCWECVRSVELAREADEAARNADTRAGIPPRFAWSRLNASELSKRVLGSIDIENASKRILASANVVFAGQRGSGKTSLAIACMRATNTNAYFVRADRLAKVPIEHPAGHGEHPLVTRAKTCKLLVLDDLGNEADTKVSAVRDVIFERHDQNLALWVTTGLTREQIRQVYGEGIMRRILEGAYVVRLGNLAEVSNGRAIA